MQEAANKMERWASDLGMRHNAGKCKLMLFSRKRNPIKPSIYINGEEIEYVSQYKYLGITITDNLSWRPHMESVAKRATNIFLQCRTMLGRTWGLTPKISKWTYTALIRPIISYASLIWLKGTMINSQLKLLERVQRKACLTILNAMTSTPTAGMEVILNIEPISIYLRSQALTTFTRLKANGNWRSQPGEVFNKMNHTKLIINLADQIPEISMPTDKLIYRELIPTYFRTFILSREIMNRTLVKPKPNEYEDNTINCCTDGSRFQGNSGAGYIIMGENLKIHGFSFLGEHTTVYQSEIHAIIEATRSLLNENLENKTINYYVDNQSAIKSLGNYVIKNKQVLEGKTLLNQLARNNTVQMFWIPGHSNHLGNEVADRLAKLAVKTTTFGPEPIKPVSDTAIKAGIRTWSQKQHQQTWSNSRNCRQTRMMLPNITSKTWAQINKLSRTNLKRITQMLTGHSTLRRHLFLMKMEDDPTCQNCLEDEETVEHYLAECPAFARERYNTLGNMFLKQKDLSSLKIKQILNFINETKRLD